jgi:hypothetical protein
MMKLGMPITVMPNAVAQPSSTLAPSPSRIATAPGSGMLWMLTLASCSVKKATTMPTALATLATERSI